MSKVYKVLTVGASGKFAGMIVPQLAARGVRVRGMISEPEKASAVLAQGATETVVADLRSRSEIAAALRGMDAAFYLAPFALENEAEAGQQFIEAAKEAGVRRIVFSSVIHPEITDLENHAVKLPVQRALVESGLEFTILNPAVFFQNIASGWKQAQRTGEHQECWSNDMSFSRVDYRDVAEVAALALTSDQLLYGTFELCADTGQNGWEVARLMSDVLGRSITAVEGPLPPVDKVPGQLLQMMRWYDQHSLVGSPFTLRAILNRPPRTLREYLVEHIDS